MLAFLTGFTGFLLDLAKDLPIIDSWLQELGAAYLNQKLQAHDTAFAKAMIALVQQHDQTLLEQAIGSVNAGKSGLDQTDIIDRPVGGGLS